MSGDTGNANTVDALIQRTINIQGFPERIEFLARHFIGSPYCNSPLNGGPGIPEMLVDRLDCFDCVTFLETVIALAISDSASAFRLSLSRIRYDGNPPAWEHRLHFTSHWLKSQERRGLLRTVRPDLTEKTVRKLSIVKGISAVKETIVFHSWEIPSDFQRGIIAFGSTRNDLDVFHIGFYFNGLLIHASRSVGAVTGEPLSEFLARENGAGLLLATFRMER